MGISHDSVNRFLHREAYTPLDLFEEVNLKGGTLSVDDTVLDKPTWSWRGVSERYQPDDLVLHRHSRSTFGSMTNAKVKPRMITFRRC
jgi:hypothetical protein